MMGREKLGSDNGESKVGMIKRALSALQWIWDCLWVKGGMGFNGFGGIFLLPISKHCPVKLQESLLKAERLKPALSRQ